MEKFKDILDLLLPIFDSDDLPEEMSEKANKLRNVLALIYFEITEYIPYPDLLAELDIEILSACEVKELLRNKLIKEKLSQYFLELQDLHPFISKIARNEQDEELFSNGILTNARVRVRGCFGLQFLFIHYHYNMSLLSTLTKKWTYLSYGGLLSLCDVMSRKHLHYALHAASRSHFDYSLIEKLARRYVRPTHPRDYRFLYNVFWGGLVDDNELEEFSSVIVNMDDMPEKIRRKIYKILCKVNMEKSHESKLIPCDSETIPCDSEIIPCDSELILFKISNTLGLTLEEEEYKIHDIDTDIQLDDVYFINMLR